MHCSGAQMNFFFKLVGGGGVVDDNRMANKYRLWGGKVCAANSSQRLRYPVCINSHFIYLKFIKGMN